MKIIWAVNVPIQSTEIDFEATDKKRKEIEATGKFASFVDIVVRIPCIRHKDFSFELCEYCGTQVTGGRAKRGWRSCSPECNKKIGSGWAAHTLAIEKQQKGKRPMFFWPAIREECFRRDNYTCVKCGKVAELFEYNGEKFIQTGSLFEAHHIVPVSEGGSNEVSNLKTLCYDCHKLEHTKLGKVIRSHKTLDNF